MNRQTLRRVSRQLGQNRQRGFTLIELLVVVSILGILAAIVTMSLVGITQMAQKRAAEQERLTVQTAYDTMLADQQVQNGSECAGATAINKDTAISDMKNFPTNKAGTNQQAPVALYPNYLRTQLTHGKYYCHDKGEIGQAGYNP